MKGEIPPDEFFRRYPAPKVPPYTPWKRSFWVGLAIATVALLLVAAIRRDWWLALSACFFCVPRMLAGEWFTGWLYGKRPPKNRSATSPK